MNRGSDTDIPRILKESVMNRERKKKWVHLRDPGRFSAAFLVLSGRIRLLLLLLMWMNDSSMADPVLHVLRLVHPLDGVGRVVALVVVVGQGIGRALVAPGADLAQAA